VSEKREGREGKREGHEAKHEGREARREGHEEKREGREAKHEGREARREGREEKREGREEGHEEEQYPGGVPPEWQVTIRRTLKEDGRYLIYYDFVPSPQAEEVELERPREAAERQR